MLALSTSFHLLFKGRVTGMSGIYFGVITADNKSSPWKLCFILISILTSVITWQIVGFDPISSSEPNWFDHPTVLIHNLSKPGYFIAGFLVGLGTKLGNGCTSGHGVCGLPRFSIRSWVYVPIFVVWAMMTATLRHYYPFLDEPDMHFETIDYSVIINQSFFLTGWGCFFFCFYYYKRFTRAFLIDILTTAMTAFVFALGLIISGMCRRSKILGFLILNSNWDVSLLIVLCTAVGVNLVSFLYIVKIRRKTIFNESLEIPTNTTIDRKLVLGGVMFGIGWGLGGLCPGPGFVLFPFLTPQISFFWFLGLTFGQFLVKIWEEFNKNQEGNSKFVDTPKTKETNTTKISIH